MMTRSEYERWRMANRLRDWRLVSDDEVRRLVLDIPTHYADVAFHASATGTEHNTTGAKTVTKPTVSAGDILICEFGVNNATTANTVTAPAGWTRIGSTITSTKVRTDVWWALQSVASTSFTVNADGAGSGDWSYTCSSYSNVDNTTPIDATGTGNSNTGANSISAATFNTATDRALELIAITNWNGGAVFSATGFSVVASATTNCQTACLYGTSVVTPAGATGGKTVNDSASATSNILCYQQFALRPAASATTAPPPFHRSQRFFRRAG